MCANLGRAGTLIGLGLTALLLALAGCSSAPGPRLGGLLPAHRFQPTAEQVASTPYAQILVEGPLGNALMVLGNDDAGLTSWYSNDRRAIFLRDELLVGTEGQPQDAMDMRIEGANPFRQLSTLKGPATVQRRYDWRPGYRYGVPVTGTLRRMGTRQITVLGQALSLDYFEEALRGDGVNAVNAYWAEPGTGQIVRSRQLVAPGISLQITMLKAYRPLVQP
ncbi:Group 4 capsule polysaccharide lipoprotein gfcB, YjbF [Pseudoxanthomonas sp. GM95]|uniref:YjbF family lipoprotein n=1 Tax=Pseudoxanthomonas sp. GM95 TaxID=1881043 RepID=UPI0008D674B7|nr:YjbF family lipoprotein [Pseudoxanthomonas sp. GM95]SEM45042.1 Group 4 capsule polysaccharide lipoprotein gfcB, YjbF [Pseudoxanthomonas sp. GM95]